MDKPWKVWEREFAKALGGKRNCEKGHNVPDVVHPLFAPEAKFREELPGWLKEAMAQAVRNAPAGKLPIVGLKEKGGWKVIVMRLEDFRDHYVNVPPDIT